MGRIALPSAARGLAVVSALALLALAGCTAANREYGEIMKGRQPCNNCQDASPWCDYLGVMRGEMPCPSSGRPTCGGDCGCAPKPACGCPTPPPSRCGPVSAAPVAMPKEAKPGEAWCRVLVPAVYETVTEKVQTTCASSSQVWVPPVYKTEVRSVLVTPGRTTTIDSPSVGRTVEICETCGPTRTEVRATTKTDACGRCVRTCETVTLPPVQKTRLETICVLPADQHVVVEPPVYSAELCEVEVAPGRWDTVELPAVTETMTKRVCVSPERWEWKLNTACTVPTPAAVAPCAPATPK